MSWFEYGSLPPKKRKLRKGVWLRVRNLPRPILDAVKPKFRSAKESIDWVVVSEMRPDGLVLLEFWCHNPFEDNFADGSQRFSVFHLLAKENPSWICEGNMGRGYKE